MYCTCNLNNQWFQRLSEQNMPTAANCNHSGSAQQIQSNGPAILKSCLASTTSHSCLPNVLSQSQNHLHCSASQLPPQQPHSQNVTPWRYYCTCNTKCIFCSNSSWWPTCPRLTASQSTSNCHPGNTSTIFKAKENQLNMSNGNCSPAMSGSPVPAPPPQPPQRTCTRCRFTIADNHTGQPTPNYGNANNTYTGLFVWLFSNRLFFAWNKIGKITLIFIQNSNVCDWYFYQKITWFERVATKMVRKSWKNYMQKCFMKKSWQKYSK